MESDVTEEISIRRLAVIMIKFPERTFELALNNKTSFEKKNTHKLQNQGNLSMDYGKCIFFHFQGKL